MRIKFLRRTVYDTNGPGLGPVYEAGEVYDVRPDEADRWFRRGAAVEAPPPPQPPPPEAPPEPQSDAPASEADAAAGGVPAPETQPEPLPPIRAGRPTSRATRG